MPIRLKDWKKFLKSEGLEYKRTNGGHEIWGKDSLKQPIVFRSNKKDIPDFIIRSNLRTLNIDYNSFKDRIKNKFII